MAFRHLIIEGCDGSGKTGLVERLTLSLAMPVHARASTSISGPVEDVDAWVAHDVETLFEQPPSIYDRHPIISEPIYAPIARNVKPFGMFQSEVWYTARQYVLAQHALLVVCLPPWSDVRRNVYSDPNAHMPGVALNIGRLYTAYKYIGRTWPGTIVWWNYKSGDAGYTTLLRHIEDHMSGAYDA
jgi:hypothetical protein